MMAAPIVPICILLLSLSTKSLALEVDWKGGGFVAEGADITGMCADYELSGYIETKDVPCSSNAGRRGTKMTEIATVESDGKFTIEAARLRTYNIFCSVDNNEKCFAALVYNITIEETATGFDCIYRFTPDGNNGKSDRFPTSAEWKKNGKVTQTLEALTYDNYTDKSNYLEYVWSIEVDRNSSSSAGEYVCGFKRDDKSMEATRQVAGSASNVNLVIKPGEVGEQYTDGDNVSIVCSFLTNHLMTHQPTSWGFDYYSKQAPMAHGYPRPTFEWTHEGVPITPTPEPIPDSDTTSSVIVIPEVDDSKHRGEYKCTAKSSDGSESSATITLHIRDKLAPLWPFIGIVAQVIVLVVVIAIGEHFRKKKVAQKQARKQQDQHRAAGPSAANA